jgi:hypothetical protein
MTSISDRLAEDVRQCLDPKCKKAKILPFAKSGKSFAIRGVWIQMAKVLTKAHVNLFSSFCHRVFRSKWKKKSKFFAVSFCYLFLLFPFCHMVFGSK